MHTNGARAQTMVQIRDLSKLYAEAGRVRAVLEGIDLDIAEGEFFVLLGKSGSGKSTLLNLISGIDRADGGSIVVAGTEITRLDERRLTLFRRDRLGIIFQFFNLIPTLTILENVTLPLELSGHSGETRARELLAAVGLADRADDFPDKLSGGEQQRVAIARALIHEPALVLADEPTGNLDEETGKLILDLLLKLTTGSGRTLIMATHSPEIVPLADTVCRIHDHKLIVTKRESVKELIS